MVLSFGSGSFEPGDVFVSWGCFCFIAYDVFFSFFANSVFSMALDS